MASMLPSQQRAPVYVGPEGQLVRLDDRVAHKDVGSSSDEDEELYDVERKNTWAKALKKMHAKKAAAADDPDGDISAAVVARMRAAAAAAQHGASATREDDASDDTLRQQLGATHLTGAGLTESIDDDLQRECIRAVACAAKHTDDALAILAASGSLACVCKDWRLLMQEELIWAQFSAATDAPTVDFSWRACAVRAYVERLALRRRWHGGVCAQLATSVHNEYIMSMVVHESLLLTASADKHVGLTSTAALRKRVAANVGSCSIQPVHGVDDDGELISLPHLESTRPTRAKVPLTRELRGHRGQVMGVHALGDHAASCAADGSLIVWSLSGACLERQHWLNSPYAVRLLDDAGRLACGSEGRVPISSGHCASNRAPGFRRAPPTVPPSIHLAAADGRTLESSLFSLAASSTGAAASSSCTSCPTRSRQAV